MHDPTRFCLEVGDEEENPYDTAARCLREAEQRGNLEGKRLGRLEGELRAYERMRQRLKKVLDLIPVPQVEEYPPFGIQGEDQPWLVPQCAKRKLVTCWRNEWSQGDVSIIPPR